MGAKTDPHNFGHISHGLAYGVFCSEWMPYETDAQVLRAGREAFPAFPSSVLAQAPQLPFLREDCDEAWNIPAAPRSVRDVTRSDIPTLVVSGGFDAQTGADNGPYVARTLSRATVVTIPYVPHGAIVYSKCAQAITVSFFDTATAPDTACVKDLKPPQFEIAP
ncbi:alpha/beta hydrolase [Streptomyces sp. NBC_01232]|uniref:alpha/beta hydrolase n=1 Tax=Streptomyces sp. NBC_01232 TaxID=2903786 RepID=UPI002E0EE818|nr:alpha/beta hydrolase [Streptomyces sp. NBC_01232]